MSLIEISNMSTVFDQFEIMPQMKDFFYVKSYLDDKICLFGK